MIVKPLRVVACGSVDDGKSTLLGRLLHDASALTDDQLRALTEASRRSGDDEDFIDFSLALDGLEAERAQSITIDVAYRAFATPHRAFILADAPGHAQYTRNMATAASTADLALLLIDARKGLVDQTRRHAAILSLLGVRAIIVAINKIDLTANSEERFNEIAADMERLAARLGFRSLVVLPTSARHGDNVVAPGPRTNWWRGPTLLAALETHDEATTAIAAPFRLPIQSVIRAPEDFRGVAGTIASGGVSLGDAVTAAPRGWVSRVSRIVSFDGDLATAGAGRAVTLVLDPPLDVTRGDLLALTSAPPSIGRRFVADLIWLHELPCRDGGRYLLKLGGATINATIARLHGSLNLDQLALEAGQSLSMNDFGKVTIETDAEIAFDRYNENRRTGGFILIDRESCDTVAAGMITEAVAPLAPGNGEATRLTAAARADLAGQTPLVLWLTGLSGAGKSTIAELLERRLAETGLRAMRLDGDELRAGLNADLGFDAASRRENVRRVGEVAKLMHDAGLIVIVSLISPFRDDRARAATLLPKGRFLEIFVDAPIDVCRSRDPKGLYARAATGALSNMTGVDQAYEAPIAPALRLRTDLEEPAQSVERLIVLLQSRKML